MLLRPTEMGTHSTGLGSRQPSALASVYEDVALERSSSKAISTAEGRRRIIGLCVLDEERKECMVCGEEERPRRVRLKGELEGDVLGVENGVIFE